MKMKKILNYIHRELLKLFLDRLKLRMVNLAFVIK